MAYIPPTPADLDAINKIKAALPEEEWMKLPVLHEEYANVHALRISHSSLGAFHACERKMEMRKFLSSDLRDESHASSLGNALHAAMLNYSQHKDIDAAIWELWLRYPYKYYTTPLEPRSFESAVGMLYELAQFDRLPHLELAYFQNPKTGEREPAIEVKFEIVIVNKPLGRNPVTGDPIPVIYVGFIDSVFFDIIERNFIVCDLKTTTRNISDWTPVYKFDQQCVPYALVLEEALGNHFETLDVLYLIAKLDLLDPKLLPYQFPKTIDDLRDWARGLANAIEDMCRYAITGWWPRKSGSCMAFNRSCYYFNMCQSRDFRTL